MHSRAMRAIDGINSAKWAWVEPKFWFKCSDRNEPRASADNSGTVIKEHPSAPYDRHRDRQCPNLQHRCKPTDARRRGFVSGNLKSFGPAQRLGSMPKRLPAEHAGSQRQPTAKLRLSMGG